MNWRASKANDSVESTSIWRGVLLHHAAKVSDLETYIDGLSFAGASSALLNSRSLLRRFDHKYLLNAAALPQLLAALKDDYALLRAGNRASASYKTLYFDTPNHCFLRDHHRGRRPRLKVRIRHYEERQLSVLEVKQKTQSGLSSKARLDLQFGQETLFGEGIGFLQDRLTQDQTGSLRALLRSEFSRITLISKQDKERVTIDFNLRLSTSESTDELKDLLIIEVKQARIRSRSPINLALKACRALPSRFSKSCSGAALLLPELGFNRFKPALRRAQRIANG
jgi:hypothetical protein